MKKSFFEQLAPFAMLSYGKILLITIAVAVAYYFTIYNNGTEVLEKITGIESQIGEETARKKDTEKILKEEEMMKANVGQTQKKFQEIKDRIPISFEETDLLAIVNEVASKNSLSPGVRVRENNIIIETDGKDTDLVEGFGWKTSFTGSYINMAQFAIDISKLEKLIRIGNFKIVIAPKSNVGSAKGVQLLMDTTIIGYRQKPESFTADPKVKPPQVKK